MLCGNVALPSLECLDPHLKLLACLGSAATPHLALFCRETGVTGYHPAGKPTAAGRAQTFSDLNTALEEYSRTGDMSVLQGLSNFVGSPDQVCAILHMACVCICTHRAAGHVMRVCLLYTFW